MIEVPRGALTADEIAREAEFFSFGTNDLTQMTFGYSRDDAEGGFLLKYVEDGILPVNPFQTLDDAVAGLMKIAVDKGRATQARARARHLRRARRRPRVDRQVRADRARLRLVLAVPRAGRAPRRRPGGADERRRARQVGEVTAGRRAGSIPSMDAAQTERPSEAQPAAPARLPHRVVVVGGGFAGLYAARSLGIDPEVRVTLVDRRNFHLFQPMLYQVATGALSPAEIAQPLRSILRKRRNTTVILGEATGIDVERRQVVLSDGGPIDYDTLIVATGARHSYFDHDEWAPIAPGLKTIEDATEIRRRILIAFEAAEREADPDRRREWMTFVLVGGGPTGVELAGALGEIARHRSATTSGRSIPRTPGSSWSRRWTGSCRRTRRTAPPRRSASSSGSA